VKFKLTLAIAGVAALAISSGSATAGNGDKVTGGGKVLFSTEDVKASTIAFTAQGTVDAAKGQVQLIDRSAGGGQSQTRFHGVVTCVETGDNFGVVSGYERGNPTGPEFLLRVIDNGQGAAAEDDLIAFDQMTEENTCGEGDDDDELSAALAKGNAKVRDGNTENQPEPDDENGASALSLLGL
jgi:hypothetical protein